MHVAAIKGGILVTQTLVSSGARVNAVDSDHLTALHYAAKYGNTPVARTLIKSGAELDVGARTAQVSGDGHSYPMTIADGNLSHR